MASPKLHFWKEPGWLQEGWGEEREGTENVESHVQGQGGQAFLLKLIQSDFISFVSVSPPTLSQKNRATLEHLLMSGFLDGLAPFPHIPLLLVPFGIQQALPPHPDNVWIQPCFRHCLLGLETV